MREITNVPADTSLADRLLADVAYYLAYTLQRILPPSTASPEHQARRDNALIAQIAALAPANAIEAEIAVNYIAESEHARDCLRLAGSPEASPQWAVKCRAQAGALMRLAHDSLARLERLQAQRRKLEQDPEARSRA